MSCSGGKQDQEAGPSEAQRKYKGVRRRKWGKWVSEIRVPGKQKRLWLGSYSSPEAAAVAHDIASYCLRGPSAVDGLNFPLMLPATVRDNMSPKSIQKAASDAGMAVDAQMILNRLPGDTKQDSQGDAVQGGSSGSWEDGNYGDWQGYNERREGEEGLNISVDDYF